MKKISRKNLPTNYPIAMTLSSIIGLDYFKASGLVWGISITLLAIIWIGVIIEVIKSEDIDIFKKDDK